MHRSVLLALPLAVACAAVGPPSQEGAPTPASDDTIVEAGPRKRAWEAIDLQNVPRQLVDRPLVLDPQKPSEDSKPGDWILAPVPFFNQQLGWGLVLGAGYIFGTDAESPPSSAGVGVMVSDNGSQGVFAGVSPRFAADTWRLTLGGGSADVRYDFFGIGNSDGEDDTNIPLQSNGDFVTFEVLRETSDDLYVGPRVTAYSVETEIRSEGDLGDLIGEELDVQDVQLGVRILNDTRDDTFFPRTGRLIDLKVDVSDGAWGSDFDYRRTTGDVAVYSDVADDVVLAWHGLAEYAGGDAPFFVLPSHRLRGYVSGRYRDRLWVATEAELRTQLTPRFGFATFVGLGWIGEDLDDLVLENWLPSYGLGLRIRLSEETPIDYRIDVAVGADEEAIVYLSAGQAF